MRSAISTPGDLAQRESWALCIRYTWFETKAVAIEYCISSWTQLLKRHWYDLLELQVYLTKWHVLWTADAKYCNSLRRLNMIKNDVLPNDLAPRIQRNRECVGEWSDKFLCYFHCRVLVGDRYQHSCELLYKEQLPISHNHALTKENLVSNCFFVKPFYCKILVLSWDAQFYGARVQVFSFSKSCRGSSKWGPE